MYKIVIAWRSEKAIYTKFESQPIDWSMLKQWYSGQVGSHPW